MVAFNVESLEKIVELYENDLDETRPQEIYKWEALYCFRQHWNPSADDYASMLDAALAKETNLLTGMNYFARGMLVEMAQVNPEKLRKMMAALLNEGTPLRQRLEDYCKSADELLVELNEKRESEGVAAAASHYQDTRSAGVYLAFANTQANYLYKAEMYKGFAKLLDLNVPGNKFDKLVAYRDLCDEILAYLEKNHSELIQKSDSMLAPEYVDADPKHHLLVQDIVFYTSWYMKQKAEPAPEPVNPPRVWMYAPGENACAWDDCLEQGIMVLGWDEIGDLAQYGSREEIADKLREAFASDSSMVNSSLACWQFQNEIQPGDIVYAKKGMYSLIGKGIVRSGARFDPNREHYTQVRDVEWISAGDWDIRNAGIPSSDGSVMRTLPMKTLTDWTMYPDAIEAVERLLTGMVFPRSDGPAHWFLVANPKIWSFADIEVGQEQFYTLFNDNGNPRRIQKNFLAAKPGDIIVGYESQPVMKVVAICEVPREHDDERMYFRKLLDVRNPVTYQQIKDDPVLSDMEFMRNYSGSLFALTDEEFGVLEELMEPESSPIKPEHESYTDDDFYNEVFIADGALGELKELLERKKNIILQGAPGTGKTFAAKRLAWAIMGCKDNTRVQLVQFHQNTTYNDFVYGYRPTEDGGFETRPGVFTEFCNRATARPDEKFFFIIDEINRANISKVFGELLMLIEADHRDESLVLPVSGDRFSVPGNVYIIGMMNTADRSLALIDYALRRRFAFYEMEPAFDNERFRQAAGQAGERMLKLVDAVKELNKTIEADALLGRGFRIGYSYFCPSKDGGAPTPESVVEYELKHLIEEYWFDSEDKAKDALEKLRGAIS